MQMLILLIIRPVWKYRYLRDSCGPHRISSENPMLGAAGGRLGNIPELHDEERKDYRTESKIWGKQSFYDFVEDIEKILNLA